MFKPTIIPRSLVFFLLANTVIALFYLITGAFGGDDVTSATRLFGGVQLGILIFTALFSVQSSDLSKIAYLYGFCFSFSLLLLIQMIPAYFWIAFSGNNNIPGTQEGLGVTAHWSYGAIHIAVIVWGLYNMIVFFKNRRER